MAARSHIQLTEYQHYLLLILLFVEECDYRYSTYVGWRFLVDLVTFLVGISCVKCDKMLLLSAFQHYFPSTYQIEFKELTMTTVIIYNKYS